MANKRPKGLAGRGLRIAQAAKNSKTAPGAAREIVRTALEAKLLALLGPILPIAIGVVAAIAAAFVGCLLLALVLLTLVAGSSAQSSSCTPPAGAAVDTQLAASGLPVRVTGKPTQLEVAVTIYVVGVRLGGDERVLLAGMETGLAESTLQNIGYGDAAGPDSRGVFQQRDPWGSLQSRLNVAESAVRFYKKPPDGQGAIDLARHNKSMSAHMIAQSVQRSAFSDGSNYLKQRTAALSWIAKAKRFLATGGNANQVQTQNASTFTPASSNATSGTVKGRVSVFGPPTEKSEISADGKQIGNRPGIALYDKSKPGGRNENTLGKNYRVTVIYKGRPHTAVLPQIDVGPHPRTGRAVDVTGAGARKLGIPPSSFPTDTIGEAIPVDALNATADLAAVKQANCGGQENAVPTSGGPTGQIYTVTKTNPWLAKIPGSPYKCDRRVMADLIYLIHKYKLQVTDCHNPSGDHVAWGEHPMGIGVDIVPGRAADRGAAAGGRAATGRASAALDCAVRGEHGGGVADAGRAVVRQAQGAAMAPGFQHLLPAP